MAKKSMSHHEHHRHMRKERIAYGLFTAFLGCIWLAAELGWLDTTIPIGPIIVIIIGFSMLLPWLKV